MKAFQPCRFAANKTAIYSDLIGRFSVSPRFSSFASIPDKSSRCWGSLQVRQRQPRVVISTIIRNPTLLAVISCTSRTSASRSPFRKEVGFPSVRKLMYVPVANCAQLRNSATHFYKTWIRKSTEHQRCHSIWTRRDSSSFWSCGCGEYHRPGCILPPT